MEERKLKIGKVQIIFFKSGKRVMIPLLVGILLTMAALSALGWAEYQISRRTEDFRAQAAQITHENDRLRQYTDELGTIQSVERIAQEELGMVSPDTVLIEAQVK